MKHITLENLLQELSEKQPIFVVVSNNLTGHRIQYLTSLFKRFSIGEVKIVVVLVSKIEFGLSIPQIKDLQAIAFDYIDDCKSTRKTLSVVRKLANRNFSSDILFWDADNWILPLLLFREKSKLLFMRPYLSQKSTKKVALLSVKWCAILFFYYVRRFDVGILGVPLHTQRLMPSLWVDDALLIPPDLHASSRDGKFSNFLPDIPANSKVVLVPGFITARKNPKLVINAIELASRSISTGIILIFAGKSDVESSSLIAGYDNPNIRHINQYLSVDEYRMLLLLSDIIVLPYTNRGSSGITIESLANGKPVILGNCELWTEAADSARGLIHLCNLEESAISRSLVQLLSENLKHAPLYLVGTKRQTVIDFFQPTKL